MRHNNAMTGVCGRCAFCGLTGCVPAANDRSIVPLENVWRKLAPLTSSADEFVVLCVASNPEPEHASVDLDSKRSVPHTDSDRPVVSYFLEMK